ncbi:MAG: 50S ribosomal protein L13 [Candidatus Brocadiia bacterium]
MRTQLAKKEDYENNRRWFQVDAAGKVLGRLATRIATALMGKDRPDYTPHVDTGAFVVVTNADKVRMTGNKLSEKVYQSFSGYPGGLREVPAEEMLEEYPERVITEAVRRMLPKNKLGKQMIKRLRVFTGEEHPHDNHELEPLEV